MSIQNIQYSCILTQDTHINEKRKVELLIAILKDCDEENTKIIDLTPSFDSYWFEEKIEKSYILKGTVIKR